MNYFWIACSLAEFFFSLRGSVSPRGQVSWHKCSLTNVFKMLWRLCYLCIISIRPHRLLLGHLTRFIINIKIRCVSVIGNKNKSWHLSSARQSSPDFNHLLRALLTCLPLRETCLATLPKPSPSLTLPISVALFLSLAFISSMLHFSLSGFWFLSLQNMSSPRA